MFNYVRFLVRPDFSSFMIKRVMDRASEHRNLCESKVIPGSLKVKLMMYTLSCSTRVIDFFLTYQVAHHSYYTRQHPDTVRLPLLFARDQI